MKELSTACQLLELFCMYFHLLFSLANSYSSIHYRWYVIARSFKIWGANTCCSIIAWWTFIKDIILHIQCDSVLDGGYWLLKRLVYNFYFPFTRRLSWHLGRLHLLDFLRVREKKTSVGFLNVQKPFNFLWIIIVSDYFLSYSLHHDVIKELIAYSYGSFT